MLSEQSKLSDDLMILMSHVLLQETHSVKDNHLPPYTLWFLFDSCVLCTGETSDFGQYFDGALADVTMVTGSTETERVIKCMNSCGEKLQFHAMDMLEVGMVSHTLH